MFLSAGPQSSALGARRSALGAEWTSFLSFIRDGGIGRGHQRREVLPILLRRRSCVLPGGWPTLILDATETL